jgi:Uma2 family endonuclease
MAMPAETSRRWTTEDVRKLMDADTHGPWHRYELLDGELVVTPAPPMEHARAESWFDRVLRPYIERHNLGEMLHSPSDLELKTGTIVQPDRYVIPNPDAERVRHWRDVKRLLLLIEVLSRSTARYDRGGKRRLYQEVRVDEYWIVDLDARLIERWRPDDERPEILRDRIAWHPSGAPEPLQLALADLWKAARLDEAQG